MKRYTNSVPTKVFFTFHYAADNWRVSQVRNMGAIEGSPVLSDNEWESIERQGEAGIQKWIDSQMANRSCVIVLIGSATAGRKWVDYEIKKAWRDRKGLCGIYIHKLLDRSSRPSVRGRNPFAGYTLEGADFEQIVPVHDPAGWNSQDVYREISQSIKRWVDDAIAVRARYP